MLGGMLLLAVLGGFEGQWVMEPADGSAGVYWLEMRPGGTGSFYGATGGRLAQVLDARVEQGRLTFRVEREFGPPKPHWTRSRVELRLVNGTVEGWIAGERKRTPLRGWRPVELGDRDDGTWRPGAAVTLVESLVMGAKGRSANWVSPEKYRNFALHVEYRMPQGSNSGVSLRGRYELQLEGDYGLAPGVHGNGAIYSRIAPRVNASRPGDEWQALEVRLVGREVTVVLNGVKTIERRRIDGPCGLSLDAREQEPGPIILQGDHGRVEFRQVRVTPLTR